MSILRFPYGLRSAVIVLIVVPVLLLFGLGGWIVLGALERQLEQRLQEDVELIARTLREPLARSLERGRTGSLRDALRSTSEMGHVFGVYVYDEDGTLVARDDNIAYVGETTLGELDVDGGETAASYGSMAGSAVYSYFTPLSDARGHAIGMLQVTRRAADMQDYVIALRWNVFIATIALCVVILGVTVAGHQLAIGRPLERLAQTMNRVSQGDSTARAVPAGPRETRWLTQRFNAMLDGLADRDDALARSRDQQRGLEEDLRSAEKQALTGRLAAGVAHELGAPLSVVTGRAQRIQRRDSGEGASAEDVRAIQSAAVRMETLIRRLLDFGSATRQQPRNVPLDRIVHDAVGMVASLAAERDVRIEVRGGEPGSEVVADEVRLREALVHLLRNAVQAAPGGQVRLRWARQVSRVTLSVENSGSPIPEEDRARIFEPFFSTKPDGQGSGLGLAIVRNTLRDHAAAISVHDSELGGAAFRIDLPVKDGEA